MKYETFDTSGASDVLLSTTYYCYNCVGNATRVITNVAGTDLYTASRFEYAGNGEAVAYALGETWDWDGVNPPTNYQIIFAREFRPAPGSR